MCGRYLLNLTSTKKAKQIRERAEKMNLVFKEGEIFPNDQVLCIIPVESKIDLAVMKWGIRNRSFQINARMESLNDRPSYSAIKEKRCAVVCSGFYEWDRDKKKYLVSAEEEVFYLGCIFNDENELLILTQAADEEFSRIHERMPIVMNQKEMISFIHNEDIVFEKKKLDYSAEEDLRLF